ncbi:unnamed protein product [Brassica oleracea]
MYHREVAFVIFSRGFLGYLIISMLFSSSSYFPLRNKTVITITRSHHRWRRINMCPSVFDRLSSLSISNCHLRT